MRPVQLELTNFGPYRKEVINFTQFDHTPLFLIGGDTGAGKSTLFDAMTVALFATTSGDRNVEEMRSTFAGPEDDLTKVTFYFQQGNHLYRIERVLQQERAKRGGGTTMQKATASLVIVDKIGGQEIEKLGDKIKEVSDQIEQILGLNAEQFMRESESSLNLRSISFLCVVPPHSSGVGGAELLADIVPVLAGGGIGLDYRCHRLMVSVADSIDVKLSGSSGPVMN